MATREIPVPDIGDFKNIPVIEIFVKPGDVVAKDAALVTLESDKAAVEVPSPQPGTIKELKVKIGDRVSKGSIIVTPKETVNVAAHPVAAVIDTTGAGDLYASGFLFGLTHGSDLAACGRLGSLCAAEIISHFGARPETPLAELARKAGLL